MGKRERKRKSHFDHFFLFSYSPPYNGEEEKVKHHFLVGTLGTELAKLFFKQTHFSSKLG